MAKVYLGIDIGGTWLKGVAFELKDGITNPEVPDLLEQQPVLKVKSRLGMESATAEFIEALKELLDELLSDNQLVVGIGISIDLYFWGCGRRFI